MDDYSFTLPEADSHHRRAFRTSIPGLTAYLPGRAKSFDVKDLSAAGLGLQANPADKFREGEIFALDLMLNNRLFLGGLQAKVMRLTPALLAGCTFEAMDARQEARLDKLVLEVQKRLIALRKAKQDKD